MKRKSRRKFTDEFIAMVVLEAIKKKSLSKLAEKFELHPNLISIRIKEFLENALSIFNKGNEDKKSIQEA